MSYIDFFEFKEHPFRITPDVAFYFTSETHAETYDSLNYFIDSDEGFFTLTGEPGTGKTITLRKFLNELPEDVEYAYILFPSLEPEDMFRAVLEDFGYEIEQGLSKNALFAGFRNFLTEKKAQGKRLLLVIDEAQNLPVDTLEELRILSNLETEKEKLIQFVLAGQPELEDKLNSNELRQLKQRITMHTRLEFLSFLELQKYVVFRLSKASYKGQYPDQKFYRRLEQLTGGNPRIINLTMERALMAAFVKQSKFLDTKDLDAAAKSLQLQPSAKKINVNYTVYILTALVLMLGLILAYQITQRPVLTEKTVEMPVKKSPEPVQNKLSEPQPEPEPDVKPAPVPEKKALKKGYVIANGLNFRSAPNITDDNIIFKMEKSTPVIIKAETDEWLLVETLDKLHTGWVFREYILIPEQ